MKHCTPLHVRADDSHKLAVLAQTNNGATDAVIVPQTSHA